MGNQPHPRNNFAIRSVYKPHSVQQRRVSSAPGQSSLLAACRHTALAAYPGLTSWTGGA